MNNEELTKVIEVLSKVGFTLDKFKSSAQGDGYGRTYSDVVEFSVVRKVDTKQ